MKSWAGIAFLALLAVAGLHSAAAAGTGSDYYLGLVIAGSAVLLIFLLIGQRGRAMPDRFLPDTDVDRPGALALMLGGFLALAGVGLWLALGMAARDFQVAGYLFVIAAGVSAVRAIGRYFDRHQIRPHI